MSHEELQEEKDPKLAEEAEKNLRTAGPLLESGDYKRAQKYFARAAKGFVMRHDPIGECNALDGLAEAYEKMGASRQALGVSSKALELAHETKDLSAQGRQLRRMALIYIAGEKPRKALECYRRCMESHRALGNRLDELDDLENLARLYDELGNGETAKKCLGRVEELARHLPDEKEMAMHLYNAAMLYRAIHVLDKTAALLVDVTEISTRSGLAELAERCQSELAALGGSDEVVEIGDDAIEVVEDVEQAVEAEDPVAQEMMPFTDNATETESQASSGDSRKAEEAKNRYNLGPPIEGIPLWEYRMVVDRGRMHRVTNQELNDVGLRGWEMIFILKAGTDANPETIYMFKRCRGYAAALAGHATASHAEKVGPHSSGNEEPSLGAVNPAEKEDQESLKNDNPPQ